MRDPNWLVLTGHAAHPRQRPGVRVWRALKTTKAACFAGPIFDCRRRRRAPYAGSWRRRSRRRVQAHLLACRPVTLKQERAFRGRCSLRSALYAELVRAVKQVRAGLRRSNGGAASRCGRWRRSGRPPRRGTSSRGRAAENRRALGALRRAIELQLSPDEPVTSQAAIPARAMGEYQGPHLGHAQAAVGGPPGHGLAHPALHRKRPSFTWLADASVAVGAGL